MEKLKEYLDQVSRSMITIEAETDEPILPLYLKSYDPVFAKILGERYIIIRMSHQGDLWNNTKIHIEEFKKRFTMPIVLFYPFLSRELRRILIDEKIAFIALNKQIFMPGAWIDINESDAKKALSYEVFPPSTQLAFLYLFYQPEVWHVGRAIAAALGYSEMTISRALNEFRMLGIVESKGEDTWRQTKRIDKRRYLEIGLRYLRSPIRALRYVSSHQLDLQDRLPLSGIQALSEYSDIASSGDMVSYAISRKQVSRYALAKSVRSEVIGDDVIELQVWQYDPKVLASNGCVDPLSLWMTFRGGWDDQRIKTLDSLNSDLRNDRAMNPDGMRDVRTSSALHQLKERMLEGGENH